MPVTSTFRTTLRVDARRYPPAQSAITKIRPNAELDVGDRLAGAAQVAPELETARKVLSLAQLIRPVDRGWADHDAVDAGLVVLPVDLDKKVERRPGQRGEQRGAIRAEDPGSGLAQARDH